MTNKIIVAKDGYNALTETNPNNLIFSSDYNTLKYYSSGWILLSINYANYSGSSEFMGITFYSHTAYTTVAHGLGYKPFFYTFNNLGYSAGTYTVCPYMWGDAGYYFHLLSFCDSTNIIFQAKIQNTANSGYGSGLFYYKIFKNNLGL